MGDRIGPAVVRLIIEQRLYFTRLYFRGPTGGKADNTMVETVTCGPCVVQLVAPFSGLSDDERKVSYQRYHTAATLGFSKHLISSDLERWLSLHNLLTKTVFL